MSKVTVEYPDYCNLSFGEGTMERQVRPGDTIDVGGMGQFCMRSEMNPGMKEAIEQAFKNGSIKITVE